MKRTVKKVKLELRNRYRGNLIMARVVDIVKLQSDRAAPREDQSFPQEPIIKGEKSVITS